MLLFILISELLLLNGHVRKRTESSCYAGTKKLKFFLRYLCKVYGGRKKRFRKKNEEMEQIVKVWENGFIPVYQAEDV